VIREAGFLLICLFLAIPLVLIAVGAFLGISDVLGPWVIAGLLTFLLWLWVQSKKR
jgi:hypothetical protein